MESRAAQPLRRGDDVHGPALEPAPVMPGNPAPWQPWAGILLAQISYTDEADLPAQKTAMESALQAIQPAAGGPWTMTWGPATDQGILAYVAANATRSVYALVFRGSLADDAAHDFIRNWLEDGDALKQDPFIFPPSAGAKISAGMNLAFGSVQGLVDPDTRQNLPTYLPSLAASSPTLMICGHSLGGALVQVGALWLHAELSNGGTLGGMTIVPFTYAAPTTGNQQFATLYDATFPLSYRAVNTLDVVPMAWENVDGVQRAYPPPGQTLSEFDPPVDALAEILKDSTGNAYRSVAGGTLFSFNGWMPQSADSWDHIAAVNHAAQTYLDYVQARAYEELRSGGG